MSSDEIVISPLDRQRRFPVRKVALTKRLSQSLLRAQKIVSSNVSFKISYIRSEDRTRVLTVSRNRPLGEVFP